MYKISSKMIIGTVQELLDAHLVTGFFITEDEMSNKVVWLDDGNEGYTTWPLWKVEKLLTLVME